MYFHAGDHIYLTYFNDEVIALDLKNDEYTILSSQYSEIVDMALNNRFDYANGVYTVAGDANFILPDDFEEVISHLREIGILANEVLNSPYPSKLIKQATSGGAPNIDWRMTGVDSENKSTYAMILEAYIMLVKVYSIIKIFGFYGIVKTIKNKSDIGFNTVDAKEFDPLVDALNKACFYFPVRTKCLEWSITLVLMGMRRRWKCNLEIGVQNLPFTAHAWVAVEDKVIADTQTLPDTLSVILSEPFKKGAPG
jgi:hypothetical protein